MVHQHRGAGHGPRERARYLSNLNQSDMALLYRIISMRVHANAVASSNNGTVSLSRLEGAGLIVTEANELKLTERAKAALGLSHPA